MPFLKGGNLKLNGEVKGKSKIISENLKISDNAVFHRNVNYWNEKGTVDFKNSLLGATAKIDESLIQGQEEFSWQHLDWNRSNFLGIYIIPILIICINRNFR
ncbi:hypothetical protein DET49_12010 [Salegentibacter sp. 24]|nr:hypothetical protein DET49_12010 [Salegentibacter sp. 24]